MKVKVDDPSIKIEEAKKTPSAAKAIEERINEGCDQRSDKEQEAHEDKS